MSHLSELDTDIFTLCEEEKSRQRRGIELIASENFASASVLEALASSFHNKYSEGYPNARYYGGTEVIDKLELLCQARALQCFNLDPAIWGVNVQCLSGSPANFAVYTALAGPHGRIMGLALPDGGHLTHGFQTPTGKKVSASSLFFESMPYHIDKQTGLIDYEALAQSVKQFQPKILIAGTSCYVRHLDYARFKQIADMNASGTILMADIAHICGLVAAGLHPSPFEHCDVVTTTTHKTLRGPRSALVFYRKVKDGKETNFGTKINEAVFPGLNGGPHNHSIAGVAVALKEAMSPHFVDYQKQVLKNMQAMCTQLRDVMGLTLVGNGSDVHLCLVDLRPQGLDGAKAEAILNAVGIVVNKNTVPGDVSAIKPSGIRIGTPAVTSRNMYEADIIKICRFIQTALEICLEIVQRVSTQTGKKTVPQNDFLAAMKNDPEMHAKLGELRDQVEKFAEKFPLPGLDY